MKTWNQLFIRHGWLVEEKASNEFICIHERAENVAFLLECLNRAKVTYQYTNDLLILENQPVKESLWLEAVHYNYRGRTGAYWCRSEKEDVIIRHLDVYISGVVRQLNRLGFYTDMSCDGHGESPAFIYIQKGVNIDQLEELLRGLGVSKMRIREHDRFHDLKLSLPRIELLTIAENLSFIKKEWLDKGADFIQKQMFNRLLEELLSIPGASGDEGEVREFVMKQLTPYVDHMTIDPNGNILAEKIYRSGQGPVILLNAHLDTVEEIVPGRLIKKDGSVWSSSEGILGADDRAGVAVLLHTARQLAESSFSGKVKYIFTVKEEVGLVGARGVSDFFLWGTDAAIVVDRRGTGDIVTSCGGYIPFCDERYGQFIESVANVEGLSDWKCTAGGSSDTRIWAEHSIQSVNLSAGYRNEHTDEEFLDVAACYRVTKLIAGIFNRSRELRKVLRDIRQPARERVRVRAVRKDA
ncbi:hypothetical protein JOC78_000406 [Bacillus ectoiniformans]|uniref:M20/M25/M40 family metallo-hydrolase n=1 Tax=Bacillus ectoiniformans TaxID=1494429 RepID=UPI00195E965D|nr:M20/M25/M40 family metallo-hydrolase [Bacillus ectoiniformans]MBM7647485.1 hypothetical protein [Bacillus ectoiniformans]